MSGRHFTGWWFPVLKTKNAGVAWHGPNEKSTSVGLSWACIANPHPEKVIRKLIFTAAQDGTIWTVAGVTLADKMPYVRADPVSSDGPNNWSGGTTMAALIEGLSGVRNRAPAFQQVRLSPRWTAAGVDRVEVTVAYPASKGYVSYSYDHNPKTRTIRLILTGSGSGNEVRFLLPDGAGKVTEALVDDKPVQATLEKIEESVYATLPVGQLRTSPVIQITYA